MAVQTCLWPLYEVEDGRQWRINHKPVKKKPLEEWGKPQSRLRHLLRPENGDLLEELQRQVDKEWEFLLRMERATSEATYGQAPPAPGLSSLSCAQLNH